MTRLAKALCLLIAFATVVAFGVSRDRLAGTRGFNPDELEHLHFSWLTSQGQVAYRDYFDHHTPLLHLTFSGWLKQAQFTGRDGAAKAIVDGRTFSLWCAMLTLTTTGVLVAWKAGPPAALTLVALLCSSANFIGKSLEFRPDVPAMLFLALGLALHANGLAFGAGFASGMALLFTPKCIFAVAGLLISRQGRKEGAMRAVGSFGLGLGLPLLAMAAWLVGMGAISGAVRFALLEAARWKGPSAWPFLVDFIRTDRAMAGLFVAATLFTVAGRKHAEQLAKTSLVMAWAGFGGLLLVTYPSRQFLLLTLPACAVTIALAVNDLVRSRLPKGWQRAMAQLILAGTIAAMGWPEHVRAFARGNTGALVAMEQISQNTDPGEVVLDGFIGYAPLRGHGTFFPFLHRDVRELRERSESPALIEALRTGQVFPKFALMNHYLQEGVDPAVWDFLGANYAPLDDDPQVRVRLFDNDLGYWSDVAVRSLVPSPRREPHAIVLGAWSAPRVWSGRSGRWLVGGETSMVLIPLREPRAFDLVLKLSTTEALSLEVWINGVRLSPRQLSRGDQDARVAVPAETWRPGLNRVVLATTPPGRRTCFVSSVQVRDRDSPR